MICYSLQPLMAAATLEGFRLPYRPVPELCRRDGWAGVDGAQGAYRWMTEQLSARHARPTADALPVWVWVEQPPAYWDEDSTGSYLTLDLDPQRLLISNYDMWDALLGESVLSGRNVPDASWAACLRPGRVGQRRQGVLWEVRPEDVVSCRVVTPAGAD